MDRFYGQRMSAEQLERIQAYYAVTPMCDLPLWAIGLRLIAAEQEAVLGFAYPWDFGLTRDYDDLRAARLERGRPFESWPGLWDRLNERRRILLTYEHPPHILGLSLPQPSSSAPMAPPQDSRRSRSSSMRRSAPMAPLQDTRRTRSRSMRRSSSMRRSTPMGPPQDTRRTRSRSMRRSTSSSSFGIRRRGPRGRGSYPDAEDL